MGIDDLVGIDDWDYEILAEEILRTIEERKKLANKE